MSFVAIHTVQTIQMAHCYLELASKCVEHVQNVSASLQFNHGQCEYLLGKLTMAVQSAEALAQSDPSGFKSMCTETMKLLWQSAK
jgi:hypothetical protein